MSYVGNKPAQTTIPVDDSVTSVMIQDDAVTSAKIAGTTIVNADVNASAAIDSTKIADGTVTNAEFQYINTLASNAQTQISARLPLAGGTMSGALACADELITRPELKDYSETKTALVASASVTCDITDGNVFTLTPDQNTTFVFSNPSATGKSCAFTLVWTQDGSDRTITWPASVDWAGGSAPDVTSGAAKIDVYTFFTLDAGTIWYGFQAGADMG